MQLRFIALVCALAAPVAAGAQPADSFEQLAGLLERGADVAVTHGGGRVEGRVLDLSPTSLTLVVEGRLLELDAAAISRVRQRWHDPTRDGAIKGFAIGFVPFGAIYAEQLRHDGSAPQLGGLVIMGLWGWAAYKLGEFVDARTTEMRDVYRVPEGRPRAAIAPLAPSRGRAGAALSISW